MNHKSSMDYLMFAYYSFYYYNKRTFFIIFNLSYLKKYVSSNYFIN